jgi:predicted unusual protein kinase regulating ubiquinone biosynthesis (AarF/ABC1/UbiB family)
MTAVLHDRRGAPRTDDPAGGLRSAVNDLLADLGTIGRLRPAEGGRLLEIVGVLARNGVVTVVRTGTRFVLEPRRQPPKALAVALRRSFVELGPTFTKLGQLIASSPGLFPPVLADELRSLLDDVPAEPARRIRRIIERELGARMDQLFASFEDEPVAAASIAQVHRAVLHDGTVVAVKVRRPNLRGRIERDLRILAVLAAALGRLGAVGESVNPAAIVDDLGASMRAELDFRREARDMTAFRANLERSGTHAGIVVPEAMAGMVGERVLVMSFVEGTSLDNSDALRAAGHDLEDLMRRGARAWIESALVHGLFHGDVHAGNLFVTPTGDIAFLDFGIMGRLDAEIRATLRRLLPSVLLSQDFTAAVQAMAELGAATRPLDLERAARDVEAVVVPLMGQSLSELSLGDLMGQIMRVATKHHLRLPRELVSLSKQVFYFERYAKELAPGYLMVADPEILMSLLAADSA